MTDANTKTTRRVKSCTITAGPDGARLEVVWVYSGPVPDGLNPDGTIRYRLWEDEQRQVFRDVSEDVVKEFCRVWGVVK